MQPPANKWEPKLSADLKYEIRKVGKVAIVSCHGPIKFGLQATELHEEIKELLSDGFRVVLDLSGVPVVDSAGIGTIFAIYTSTLNSDSRLALAGLTPFVKEVLTLTKALSLMPAYPDAESAFQALT